LKKQEEFSPARSAGDAEIENAPGPQLALLELRQRDQVAMGRYRDEALHDRGVAAPQQHRLAAREAGGIGAADAERWDRPQAGVDGLQEPGERGPVPFGCGRRLGRRRRLQIGERRRVGSSNGPTLVRRSADT
jgi:hypothetical protein